MGRNVRAEESRAEMVLGRGVPEPKFSMVILSHRYRTFFLGIDFTVFLTAATVAFNVVERCTCDDVLHRIKSFTFVSTEFIMFNVKI